MENKKNDMKKIYKPHNPMLKASRINFCFCGGHFEFSQCSTPQIEKLAPVMSSAAPITLY